MRRPASALHPTTVALVNEYSRADERGGNFGLFNTFRLVGFGFAVPFVVATLGGITGLLLVVTRVFDPAGEPVPTPG